MQMHLVVIHMVPLRAARVSSVAAKRSIQFDAGFNSKLARDEFDFPIEAGGEGFGMGPGLKSVDVPR
jgi:hypothetical protein